ncbi:serine/threonine-protein kinase [Butyrivibrio fibrisolvens]|uniref:serine/threonine-protein kinase n=1 Tax=Butyrivibrio fibrisolvens TaxID=831 RepID=UPI0003F8AAD0|nr:serine/threonine-protein kinase [Butyrivibrio fibrisolvens]
MGIIRCPHCQEMIPDDFTHCGFCGKDVKVKNEKYMLQIGTVLQDRYYIGAAIGQGGFGITYSCCDLRLDMKVAIKEYYPDRLVQRDTEVSDNVVLINPSKKSVYDHEMNKCLLEARTLGDFADEPGVVRVSDIFNQNETVYIVMEYLEGMTLEQFRKRNPDVTFDFCYKMLSPVIKVLERIHERGLIHRDISPSNIMVLPDGRAKLLDFGSASRFDKPDDSDEILVLRSGYSPIEQYQKNISLGPWTDVYAFCATFYYMLTGVNPVSADERVGGDTLVRPSKMGAEILGGQEDALMHGLAITPELRTRSMKQLTDEMELKVPVIKPEQIINARNEMKSHVIDEISGMVTLTPDSQNALQDTKKIHQKISKKKLIVSLVVAVICILAGTFTLKRVFYKEEIVNEVTAYSLINESAYGLDSYENIKLKIKTTIDCKKSTSYKSESSRIEEVTEVWKGQGDSLYVKDTSSVGDGNIAYIILDHLNGDTYRISRHEANSYSIDDSYNSYIITALLNASYLNGSLKLAEDKAKINDRYYYKVTGELNPNAIVKTIDELNIYEDIPKSYIKNYGLVPNADITAYFDSEDHRLKRITITMKDFDCDAINEKIKEFNEVFMYSYDKIGITMTVDYAYGENAVIDSAEEKRFTDTKAKIEEDSDVSWEYGWGYIWGLDLFE